MENHFFKFLGITLILNLCIPISSASLDSLIGSNIIIAPFSYQGKNFKNNPINYGNKDFIDIVYTNSVLKKGKFKKEFLHNDQNIYGIPIFIRNILFYNKGKADECIGISALRNNDEIVIHIPLKYNRLESPLSSIWLSDKQLDNNGIIKSKKENIIIPTYNPYLIDSISKGYLNKVLYPVKGVGSCVREQQLSDYYFSDSRVTVGYPYIFMGFAYEKLIEDYVYLTAIFEDSNGRRVNLSLEPRFNASGKKNVAGLSLENFFEIFMSEEELSKEVFNKFESVIDSVKNLRGKEIFLHDNNCKGFLLEPDGAYKGKKDQWIEDFYTIGEILMIPALNQDFPFLDLYVELINEKSHMKYAYPMTKEALLFFEDSTLKREEFSRKEEIYKKELEELAIIQAKKDGERKIRLIKKYGQVNAELILKGYVKVGFTKEMCLEVESTSIFKDKKKIFELDPSESQWGHTECWVYPNGTIYYFKGNKLNRIH